MRRDQLPSRPSECNKRLGFDAPLRDLGLEFLLHENERYRLAVCCLRDACCADTILLRACGKPWLGPQGRALQTAACNAERYEYELRCSG